MPTNHYKTVTEFINDVSPTAERIAVCGLFRSRGGASRVIQQQAIDLNEAGYDVTVFALEADMDAPEGVSLVVPNPIQDYQLLSKAYWLLFPFLPWMLSTVVKLRSFDVVIVHRYPFTVAGYVSSRLSDVLYTYWSHPSGDSAAEFSGIAKVWSRILHRFETQGRSVVNADYVCAVSENSREYLESKIDRSITVVPNKINERRFTTIADPKQVRHEYDIDDEDAVILFVGRITERKNVHSLVQMFEDIARNVNGIKLVIVGTESQPEYGDYVRDLAGPNTIFTGYISDEKLAGLYEIADVFATCSLEEGWGLPISEAQYFDTPVVAYDFHPAAQVASNKILVEKNNHHEFKQAILSYVGPHEQEND